jgi:hypothetical protein
VVQSSDPLLVGRQQGEGVVVVLGDQVVGLLERVDTEAALIKPIVMTSASVNSGSALFECRH